MHNAHTGVCIFFASEESKYAVFLLFLSLLQYA